MWQLVENVAYVNSQIFLGDLKINYSESSEIERGVSISSVVEKDQDVLNPEIILT